MGSFVVAVVGNEKSRRDRRGCHSIVSMKSFQELSCLDMHVFRMSVVQRTTLSSHFRTGSCAHIHYLITVKG